MPSRAYMTEGRSVRGSENASVARCKTAVVAGVNQTYEWAFRNARESLFLTEPCRLGDASSSAFADARRCGLRRLLTDRYRPFLRRRTSPTTLCVNRDLQLLLSLADRNDRLQVVSHAAGWG